MQQVPNSNALTQMVHLNGLTGVKVCKGATYCVLVVTFFEFFISIFEMILSSMFLSSYSHTHFTTLLKNKNKIKTLVSRISSLKSWFEKAAFGPACEILVFITCAYNHTLNEHAQSSSASRGQTFK